VRLEQVERAERAAAAAAASAASAASAAESATSSADAASKARAQAEAQAQAQAEAQAQAQARAEAQAQADAQAEAQALLQAAPPPAAPPAPPAAAPVHNAAAVAAALKCRMDSGPSHEAYVLSKREEFANDVHTVFGSWSRAAASGLTRQPRVIFEVGANKGQTGRSYLEYFPQASVHSFELSLGTFGLLSQTRNDSPPANRDRWHLYNMGMSSEPGIMTYSAGREPGDQTASLGEDRRVGLSHSEGLKATITTVAIMLDTLKVPFVDLLKIDVEGWDRDVIKGADFARNAPRIGAVYFECGSTWYDSRRGRETSSIEEVIASFDELGYECFFSGLTDLARVTAPPGWRNSMEEFIQGYGPNVMCLSRRKEVAEASNAILNSHKEKLSQCPILRA